MESSRWRGCISVILRTLFYHLPLNTIKYGIISGKKVDTFPALLYLTHCDMKPSVTPNDVLVDGFLAHMFSSQDSHAFFALLLRTPDFLRYYRVSYSRGVWYITQNVPSVRGPSVGVPTQNPSLPLDFSVKGTQGTVVPQRRWIPADRIDFRRFVAEATLQLPIFFVNRNGVVGFWLPDILQGSDRDLYNRDSEASLGGVATTHVRINVSSHTLY